MVLNQMNFYDFKIVYVDNTDRQRIYVNWINETKITKKNTCSGLTSSPTFNLASDNRISSNLLLACSKSKSLSNLIVFGRPLLFWF